MGIIHSPNVGQLKKDSGGNFGNQNISHNKNNNMKFLILFILISFIWIAYEMWSAPMGEETEDGYREIRPPKKFKDLWRKRS